MPPSARGATIAAMAKSAAIAKRIATTRLEECKRQRIAATTANAAAMSNPKRWRTGAPASPPFSVELEFTIYFHPRLLLAVQQAVARNEHIHLGSDEASIRIFGRTDDRLPAHV